MPIIDLKCRYSFASPASDCQERRQKALFLGHHGQIYLFFNLPVNLNACVLRKASLILFKLPDLISCSKKFSGAGQPAGRCALYPLLDFFNASGGIFSPPAVSLEHRVDFEDVPQRGNTEVNITQIVKDWNDGTLENRGILLTGSPCSPCLYYASDRYKTIWMRPLIRLVCGKIEITRALRAVPCEVRVKDR